jgi:hypothetical protein
MKPLVGGRCWMSTRLGDALEPDLKVLELCSSCQAWAYQPATGLRKEGLGSRIQLDSFPDWCTPFENKQTNK